MASDHNAGLLSVATIRDANGEHPVFVDDRRGILRPQLIDRDFAGDALDLIRRDLEVDLQARAANAADAQFEPIAGQTFTAPYRSPRKIWGIGLNYVDHAGDLAESVPDEPASFIKGDHTIIGGDETIVLPIQSGRVTVEAELGLIIGRPARNVAPDQALDHVWGVCPILDQTAEDILRRNPRFLTRAKNFPTFFSFGPMLVPLARVLAEFGSLDDIAVSTVRNDSETRTNTVSNMTFGLEYLVSFHSEVMPLFTGDIISTGTPGAIVVADGDVVECRIPGIGHLTNTVRAAAARP